MMDANEFRRRQEARVTAHWRALQGKPPQHSPRDQIDDAELKRLQRDATVRALAKWDPEEAREFRGGTQGVVVALIEAIQEAAEDFEQCRATPYWEGSYQDYLRTDHWRELRQVALQRAGFRCERCENRENLPLDVHHRDYRHLGAEREHDLMVLCRMCHKVAHGEAT